MTGGVEQLVRAALTDPAVERVRMDGDSVWVAGATAPGRADVMWRLLREGGDVS